MRGAVRANDSPAAAARQTKPKEQEQGGVSPDNLKTALSHPSQLHRIGAFALLLDHLSPAHFTTLNAQLSAWNPPPDPSILALFFRRWALVAPEAALDASIKKQAWTPVLTAWGERDPEAALARFEQLTFITGFSAAALRDDLRALLMPKPGQLPPRDAVRRIRELQGSGEASPAVLNSMSAILTEWAKTDPEAAWQEALALPAEGTGAETREWALSSVFRARAGIDPDAALQWLGALPDGPERENLRVTYVSALAWAGKSRLAREYALAMPDGSTRQKAIGELSSALLRQNPEEAQRMVANLPAADWRDPSVFRDVFQGWLRTDPDHAIEVFLQHFPTDVPSGPAQQDAYRSMFFGWSGRNPRQASELFLKLPKSIGAKLLEQSVTSYAYEDPAAAGSWAVSLPAGETRDRILAQVAATWTRRGASSVTQWLDQLPPDSGKSAAIESFAKILISSSPDDALAWLRAVPTHNDRLERLHRVWSAWSDRKAAQQWLETSRELTEAERNVLRAGGKSQ